MDLAAALAFASPRRHGVLGTIRKDGRPQLSNIMFVASDGTFLISVTETRAKTRNLRRDPRAVLYVPGDDPWSFVVLDGTVELSAPATTPDDATTEALVDYYRRGAGEHPDWQEFRSTMVREQRVLAGFRASSAYGMVS